MPTPTNEEIDRDVRAAEKAGRETPPAQPDTRAKPSGKDNDVPAPFKTDDR